MSGDRFQERSSSNDLVVAVVDVSSSSYRDKKTIPPLLYPAFSGEPRLRIVPPLRVISLTTPEVQPRKGVNDQDFLHLIASSRLKRTGQEETHLITALLRSGEPASELGCDV